MPSLDPCWTRYNGDMVKINTFVANEPDDNHCLQACITMAINAFTGRTPSLAEVDSATGYVPGRLTWPFGGYLYLAAAGIRMHLVEDFDYELFARNPREALITQTEDSSLVDEILNGSDIESEVKRANACLEHKLISLTNRQPTFEDIAGCVDDGGLVLCNVNARVLAGEDGWLGHFVLIDARTGSDQIRIQNPGLPAEQDRWISWTEFEAAWCSPTPDAASALLLSAV